MPQNDYNLALSEDKRELLSNEIDEALIAYKTAMEPFWAKVQTWRDKYEGNIPETKSEPFAGASSLHIPLTKWICDAIQARSTKTVFGVKPFWIVKGRGSEDEQHAKTVEGFLDYLAEIEMKMPLVADDLFARAIIDGTGISKLTWDKETRVVEDVDIQPLPAYDETGEPMMQVTGAIDPVTGEPLPEPVMEPTPVRVKRELVDYEGPRARVIDIMNKAILPVRIGVVG